MKVEGQPNPRFQAFTLDIDGNAHECVFARNELLELKDFKPRADRRYKWKVDGRWMSSSEFDRWRAQQSDRHS